MDVPLPHGVGQVAVPRVTIEDVQRVIQEIVWRRLAQLAEEEEVNKEVQTAVPIRDAEDCRHDTNPAHQRGREGASSD